jgi:hypothetical protein
MPVHSKTELWRGQAALALAAASRMTDVETRRGMCQVALGYWLLAERAERNETTDAPETLPKSSYSPECLTTISRAFGEAWDAIAAQVGDDLGDAESARNRLAQVMLALVDEETSDAAALKEAALLAFALRSVSS